MTVRTVYQDPRDKGRWHLSIMEGEVVTNHRLSTDARTRDEAEQDATRF